MLTSRFHLAAKIIESDGIGGFKNAAMMVGYEAAFALVVAHCRRDFRSMSGWPSDPEIDQKVNGLLSQNLTAVYETLSQHVTLFYMKHGYCFDNFSAFAIEWRNMRYPTAEHAYQSAKFVAEDEVAFGEGLMRLRIAETIRNASSAHEAKKLGNHPEWQIGIRKDWEVVKLRIMEEILRAKHSQHKYVRRKLSESAGKILIEDSENDSFWGRGPDWKGQNHLGRLWMKIRDEKL